jgi:hypothetical protein
LISFGSAVAFLPGSLAVSSWLKRTEQVDFFDTDTDFNPLKVLDRTSIPRQARRSRLRARGSRQDFSRSEKSIPAFAA